MKYEQQSPSSIKNNPTNSLKCCGLGCKNVGKYKLKIVWIKKSGWFCSRCADDIRKDGFVDENKD